MPELVYLNFDIEIEKADGAYRAHVLRCDAGPHGFSVAASNWDEDRDANGPYKLRFRGQDFGTDVTINADAWYRIEIHASKNATSTMAVYDSSGTSVGSSSVTAVNIDTQYISYGGTGTFPVPYNMWFDDFGFDWTNHTTPLWPYTVGN